jgi:hypothetical protein
MKLCNFKTLIIVAMVALLMLPIAACAPKAGTLTVEPAKIDFEMLKQNFPPIAKALGLPESMAATVPQLAMLAIPVTFKGTGWQPNEIITIDLVVPPDVEMTGLDRERGEDSVGIAFATADDKGNFEAKLEKTATIGFILRGGFTPTLAPDPATLIPGNPLPNGIYTLRAVGEDARSVATKTWDLQLVAPPASPAAPVEAAEYTNAELGFSVKYPNDWKQSTAIESPTIVFVAQAEAQVPLVMVDIAPGATFDEALNAALTGGGSSDIKIKSEKESALADDTKAFQAVYSFKNPIAPMAVDALSLGIQKGDKWVIVTVATINLLAKFDEAKFSEIVHTLQFTK